MRLSRLLHLSLLPSVIVTQRISCGGPGLFPHPLADNCMRLIFILEHKDRMHRNVVYGARRHGDGHVPQCWSSGDCQICIGLAMEGDTREEAFSVYLYVGSMEATVQECIAHGPGAGYFGIGTKGIFRLLIYGNPTSSSLLSDTAARNGTIRMLGATPNRIELSAG